MTHVSARNNYFTSEEIADIKQRVGSFEENETRLYRQDFLKRQWIATYAADAAVMVDYLWRVVNAEAKP